MDIGKKQQIMVDWFRKTLDESKKPWNTQVYLITDKYHVYIANKDIRLIGSNFGKAIDRPLKYFLFTDGKVQYFNSIEFLGYLPFELRDEYPVNCKPLNPSSQSLGIRLLPSAWNNLRRFAEFIQ